MTQILGALRKANSAVVRAQFRSSDKLSSPLGNFRKFATRSSRKNCPISTACKLCGRTTSGSVSWVLSSCSIAKQKPCSKHPPNRRPRAVECQRPQGLGLRQQAAAVHGDNSPANTIRATLSELGQARHNAASSGCPIYVYRSRRDVVRGTVS